MKDLKSEKITDKNSNNNTSQRKEQNSKNKSLNSQNLYLKLLGKFSDRNTNNLEEALITSIICKKYVINFLIEG